MNSIEYILSACAVLVTAFFVYKYAYYYGRVDGYIEGRKDSCKVKQ